MGLVKRADKVAFYGVVDGSTTTFTRMKGFTDMSGSKNPIEYSRKYVDENYERTDVTGYSPSWSYAFDELTGDAVITDIAKISDEELTGEDAIREIVMVDFSSEVSGGGYKAIKRTFAVIADGEGDSTDAYTYSGNFKVVGDRVEGTATIATPTAGTPASASTVTFTAA